VVVCRPSPVWLHDKSHVDIGRHHLHFDVAPGGFAPQERASWQQLVNAGLRAGIAVMHADPVAHAGQFVTDWARCLNLPVSSAGLTQARSTNGHRRPA